MDKTQESKRPRRTMMWEKAAMWGYDGLTKTKGSTETCIHRGGGGVIEHRWSTWETVADNHRGGTGQRQEVKLETHKEQNVETKQETENSGRTQIQSRGKHRYELINKGLIITITKYSLSQSSNWSLKSRVVTGSAFYFHLLCVKGLKGKPSAFLSGGGILF